MAPAPKPPNNLTAPSSSYSSAIKPPPQPPLSRVPTGNSTHAQVSLRRMATHETGEVTYHDGEDEDHHDGLDTHDEHEHEHEEGHSTSSVKTDEEAAIEGEGTLAASSGEATKGKDENPGEGAGGKKKKTIELQDQTNLLPLREVILVFVGLTCALFCSLLDQTIVTTALPTLGRVFNRADISSWVGTAYLLTSTAMQPIYGRLSDIFGRKMILVGSLIIFFIGSVACAEAQTMIQLIVFRAIQGIGGGGILTLAMIIISDVVSLKDRGKYQGFTGCVVAMSNSIGPILGGVFTEKATWRWCFYINLPLTAMSALLVVWILPLRRPKGTIMSKLRMLDWYGSILTLAWAVLVLLGLSWAGSQYAWSSAAVLCPIILGLALLGVFLFVEAKLVPLPLVPLRMFRNSTVASAMASTFFSGAVFYSTLYYLPQYFQVVRGASAIRSGVLLLPLVTVQTVCAFGAGLLQSKTGDYWWNLNIGFFIWTIALGLLSSIDENTSLAKVAGFQILTGIGAGQTFQTSLVAIQAAVPRKEMATATGLRNFLRQLGGTLALTICSSIINNTVRTHLASAGLDEGTIASVLADPTVANSSGLNAAQQLLVHQAYSTGINGTFYFMIPCAGISFLLTLFFVKKNSLNRNDDAAKKKEAKAWVEAKREKKKAKRGGASGEQGASGTMERVVEEAEEAGRGEAEAGGLDAAKKEGLEQGPVGGKR